MLNCSIEKLTEALRSGKYEQGQGALCAHGKYCCLGVACMVYQEAVGDLEIEEEEDGVVSFDGSTVYLPEKVQAWFGFKTFSGGYGDGNSLVKHNDNGVSFRHIANIIEERYDELC